MGFTWVSSNPSEIRRNKNYVANQLVRKRKKDWENMVNSKKLVSNTEILTTLKKKKKEKNILFIRVKSLRNSKTNTKPKIK